MAWPSACSSTSPASQGASSSVGHQRALLGGDRAAVEIGRGPAVDGRAVLAQQHELQPLRDDPRLARAGRPPVADRVLEVDQEARLGAAVGLVDQHAALPQQRLEPLEHDIDRGVEQRVPGRDELGLRLAGDQRLLEGDPGVAVEDGIAAADQAVALLQDRGTRRISNRPRSRSAIRPPSSVNASRKKAPMKCGCSRRALRPLHLLADRGDARAGPCPPR